MFLNVKKFLESEEIKKQLIDFFKEKLELRVEAGGYSDQCSDWKEVKVSLFFDGAEITSDSDEFDLDYAEQD